MSGGRRARAHTRAHARADIYIRASVQQILKPRSVLSGATSAAFRHSRVTRAERVPSPRRSAPRRAAPRRAALPARGCTSLSTARHGLSVDPPTTNGAHRAVKARETTGNVRARRKTGVSFSRPDQAVRRAAGEGATRAEEEEASVRERACKI